MNREFLRLIANLLLLFGLGCIALGGGEYGTFYQLILDKKHGEVKKFAFDAIQKMKSKPKKKQMLLNLKNIQHELIDLDDFESEIVRLKDPSCVIDDVGNKNCGTFRGYSLSQKTSRFSESLTFKKGGEEIFQYRPDWDTEFEDTRMELGENIHGIRFLREKGLTIFIIREIVFHKQAINGSEKILRQRLSFFRMEGAHVCKIGRVDATRTDYHYEEMATYIKVLGPLHKCSHSIVNF